MFNKSTSQLQLPTSSPGLLKVGQGEFVRDCGPNIQIVAAHDDVVRGDVSSLLWRSPSRCGNTLPRKSFRGMCPAVSKVFVAEIISSAPANGLRHELHA